MMAKIILVVDDSSSVRKFITLALKLKGYKVITAMDGMEAMEKLSNNQVDLVVTDLNMPNVDGIKLIKSIREYPEYENLPIIILTSLTKEEDINLGMEAGANSYLIKPFNTKKIQYEVSKYLEE
ncbi:MAG: two-component system, chemotaxis family, chemotaxis protein CheY [Bacteroidota bacterium]|nr:two-component system, chemotaxis family, chemotaxis protein CheY [Bacteroidota bacterium]